MIGVVFIDTNAFLYALDSSDKSKQKAARSWRVTLWEKGLGRISYQVLQEFYAKVMHRWPDAQGQARAEINDLLAWNPVLVDGQLMNLHAKCRIGIASHFGTRSS